MHSSSYKCYVFWPNLKGEPFFQLPRECYWDTPLGWKKLQDPYPSSGNGTSDIWLVTKVFVGDVVFRTNQHSTGTIRTSRDWQIKETCCKKLKKSSCSYSFVWFLWNWFTQGTLEKKLHVCHHFQAEEESVFKQRKWKQEGTCKYPVFLSTAWPNWVASQLSYSGCPSANPALSSIGLAARLLGSNVFVFECLLQ